MELLKQKTFCAKLKKQDTGQRCYMQQGILAGNLIMVSIILLCLATFSYDIEHASTLPTLPSQFPLWFAAR